MPIVNRVSRVLVTFSTSSPSGRFPSGADVGLVAVAPVQLLAVFVPLLLVLAPIFPASVGCKSTGSQPPRRAAPAQHSPVEIGGLMKEIANRLLDPRGPSTRRSQAERVGRKALQRNLHRRTPLEQVLAACFPATAQWARAVFAVSPRVAFGVVTEGRADRERNVVSALGA